MLKLLPYPAIVVIAGDFNARIVNDSLDQYSHYIGPAVFPHDTPFDLDSNYSHLLDFLIQNEFTIASSRFKRPPARIITYREISSDPSISHHSPTPSDFAAIDHVLVSHRHARNVTNTLSRFEHKLPWFHRHFPVEFSLCFDKFSPPRKPPSPKTLVPRTDAEKIQYRSLFPSDLPNVPTRPLRDYSITGSITIYTDGSCLNQYDIRPGNPAGWAFTFKKDFNWIDSFGPVGQNLNFTPIGSNNSAELQALIEAVDYMLRRPAKFSNLTVDIYTDSMLVYNIAHDLNIPSARPELVSILRRLREMATQRIDLAILKIRAHVGHEGNERADKLAFHGVTNSSNLGRHSNPPRLPLHTVTPQYQMPGALDSQAQFLLETVLQSSSSLKPTTDTPYEKEYLCITTKNLIDLVQQTPANDYERLTRLRKAVKRHVKKDKRQHLCDNLLQDSTNPPSKQWQTLKFVRKPYVPRTQSVIDSAGHPCSKNHKAQVLAKHLADKVWCEAPTQELPQTRLYPEADIPLHPFTESELDSALHRMRHRRAPGPDQAPVELWKFAPRHCRLLLLDHYNQVFTQASSPRTWCLAHVIMIFKGKKKRPETTIQL